MPRTGAGSDGLLRNFFLWLSTRRGFTDAVARRGLKYGFAQRFIPGERLEDALAAGAELSRAGRRLLLNELGENVTTGPEARRARDHIIEVFGALDRAGLVGNVSVKLTHLGLDFDEPLCASLLDDIALAAKPSGHRVEIDMENSSYTERTLDIFAAAQSARGNLGVAIQAYLRRSERDLERLGPVRPEIRLVKGAYNEPHGVAFKSKKEVDANYRRLLDLLLEPGGRFYSAVATHDPELIAYAEGRIAEYRLAKDRYEFQMIYGVRRDLQEQVVAAGNPLRIYLPFGTAWCPYFMRRLAERPANVWFLLRSLLAERNSPR
jgi:proline dehydrogenase